ncbi:unnamed protein product [Rotaria sp. Silwood2]|nr:unnamed protein product [Rotaria sp. Silwood2]CAF3998365.1 unnamed protein product [Rotaria sp. Silwood2]
MTQVFDITDTNKTVLYAFRFGTSNKLVHLTQQELNRVPYLFNLVTHKDDFLLVQNENGEYVLSHPIEYNWFMSIFRSITSEQPYILFNELSEENNILDTLELFDYLGIDLFPLPLLKYKSLVLSNPIKTDNDKKRIVYHKANISETRQTAAEFIIALGKNQYDLYDLSTLDYIFYLITIILSNSTIFNSRFRHHTLIIAEECCYSFFSKKQRCLLPTSQQIAQHRKIDTLMYLYDDDKPLPDDFCNTFAWRGAYVPEADDGTDCLSASSKIIPCSSSSERTNSINDTLTTYDFIDIPGFANWCISPISFASNDFYNKLFFSYCEVLPIYQNKKNLKNVDAQSARSKRFNTLPARPKVDKFKHRCGPKAQKYR